MELSWHSLISNKDQDQAFQTYLELLIEIQPNDLSVSQSAQIFLAASFALMDYADFRDEQIDIKQSKRRSRLIRFGNFLDYAEEYTQKRIALQNEGDVYIEKKHALYEKTKRSYSSEEERKDSVSSLISKQIELEHSLIVEGLDRLSVARALLDVAFLCAKIRGDAFYGIFLEKVLTSVSEATPQDKERFEFEDYHARLQGMNRTTSSTIH